MTGVERTEIFEKLLPACCRNAQNNGLNRHWYRPARCSPAVSTVLKKIGTRAVSTP